jgi:hypothetical protein
MLFHMEKSGASISGWVCPDNPSTVPRIQIIRPDATVAELETNVFRPDVRDRGHHHTGHVGFNIDPSVFPDLAGMIDHIQIRDFHTGVLLYRAYDSATHLPLKVFRFEPQAMPYAHIEALWDKNFALYYNAVERYPFDTMFGILNNPSARSIALSGRASLQRYEHFFRERDYKIVALLRDPFEELAERLLFIRYALAPQSPKAFDDHLTGLQSLGPAVRKMNLDDLKSVDAMFAMLTNKQKAALTNPLVRALACQADEMPRKHHVEVALTRLATMDLVGVRPCFTHFSDALARLLGRNLLAGAAPSGISWTERLAKKLSGMRAARSLIAFDLQVYQLTLGAVRRVIEGEQVPARRPSKLREASHLR